jgi:hydroxylamine reductase (hybrid-cluster protein)
VVTAGCAGAALARAGMCRPEYAARTGLKGPIPAVLHIGSCHDAGEFLAMAQDAQKLRIPVYTVMLEVTHNKVLATAIAFAAKGIRTYVDPGEADPPEMKLPGGPLFSTEPEQLIPKPADVVAA